MVKYLEFKDSMCRDCYKCLRYCPAKAIKVVGHQARIIEERCLLCGKCTSVCPQNAKRVHSEIDRISQFLRDSRPVVASLAPSYISSFKITDMAPLEQALRQLGFAHVEETAIGAKLVTKEYRKLLLSKKYKNLITSACPSVNKMIQMYYPKALPYLAPVVSPMIAHAMMLKKAYPQARIVFIGPCIAKKKEAYESKIIDATLTFEDLDKMLKMYDIHMRASHEEVQRPDVGVNRARYYPISRGIIKSFEHYVDGYEFVAVDGIAKCKEVIENIDSLTGMFLELNSCEFACVNGPCSLIKDGTAVKANADIRIYASQKRDTGPEDYSSLIEGLDFGCEYERIEPLEYTPSEKEILAILEKTGKLSIEDELNCGACGYNSCRDKAWAVLNGYAEIEMCVPYMRERAESMSNQMIQNSPNGIVLVDHDLNLIEVNNKALELFGINNHSVKGRKLYDYYDSVDFILAQQEGTNLYRKKVYIEKTASFVELSIVHLKKEHVLFGVFKDITAETAYENKLNEMRMTTLATTDHVIKKQMRVAQEIASLLGETTAESKIALLKLKESLQNGQGEGQ